VINVWLVQLWLQAVSALDVLRIKSLLQAFTAVAVSLSRPWFMFITAFNDNDELSMW
jgi:hypothetical protein